MVICVVFVMAFALNMSVASQDYHMYTGNRFPCFRVVYSRVAQDFSRHIYNTHELLKLGLICTICIYLLGPF